MNPDLKRTVCVNLRCVTQSCKGGVPLNRLQDDYKSLIGSAIPFQQLGFSNLEIFLKSIPEVVYIEGYGKDSVVQAVADATTKHIAKLISKQKSSKTSVVTTSKYKRLKIQKKKQPKSAQELPKKPDNLFWKGRVGAVTPGNQPNASYNYGVSQQRFGISDTHEPKTKQSINTKKKRRRRKKNLAGTVSQAAVNKSKLLISLADDYRTKGSIILNKNQKKKKKLAANVSENKSKLPLSERCRYIGGEDLTSKWCLDATKGWQLLEQTPQTLVNSQEKESYREWYAPPLFQSKTQEKSDEILSMKDCEEIILNSSSSNEVIDESRDELMNLKTKSFNVSDSNSSSKATKKSQPLRCIPMVERNVRTLSLDSLLALYFLLKGGSISNVLQEAILDFEGYSFEEGSPEWIKKLVFLDMLPEATLRSCADVLCLPTENESKDHIRAKIMKFLTQTKDSVAGVT